MLSTSLRTAAVLLVSLTAGCGGTPLPSFYSVPVRQGNYIDQNMVDRLQPGMTRQQVQRIMGTPLVADPFHQNRWDYYYSYSRGGSVEEQRHITLFFNGDLLSHASNDLPRTN